MDTIRVGLLWNDNGRFTYGGGIAHLDKLCFDSASGDI